MKQIDFFGDDHDVVINKIKRKKYRTMQEIYGIIPEKTCKTCTHCIGHRRNIRVYYKCDLWFDTHCDATDIRLKNQACKCYVEEAEK